MRRSGTSLPSRPEDAELPVGFDGEPPDGPAAGAPIGRRVVLGMLGLGAAGILVGGRVQRTLTRVLPSTDLLPSSGGFRFYSVAGYNPSIPAPEYRLRVAGGSSPVALGLAELRALPPVVLTRDFQCVTGWRVPDVAWTGVRVRDVLDAAGVPADARFVHFTSADRVYTERLTMDQARRDDVIVAYGMRGGAVPQAHGGPVRLYVAPMYGYKSLKWLDGISVGDSRDPGYWELRGYDSDAWVGQSNGRNDRPTAV